MLLSADSHLYLHSVDVIKKFQEHNGAFHASPTFIAYKGYCWLRDGSFIAYALSSIGEIDSASNFFDWCSNTIISHSDLFASVIDSTKSGKTPAITSMPPARFTFSGEIRNDGWENFQLDGYGTWLWAAITHAKRHNLSLNRWRKALRLTVTYLVTCWDRTCYDWWEEHFEQQHISTLGCIAAGLREAIQVNEVDNYEATKAALNAVIARINRYGVKNGYLTKWIGTNAIDASLAALIAPLRVIDPASSLARNTVERIDKDLCFNNGTHRFLDDKFYGGGQWPLLSCFLGLAYISIGNKKRANELLKWVGSTALDNFDIPEQVDGHLLDSAHRPYWLNRWGEVASPLLWSHAMFLCLYHQLHQE